MCKRAFKEKAIDLTMDLIHDGKKEGFNFDDIAEFIGGAKSTVKGYAYGEKIPSFGAFLGMLRLLKSKKVIQEIAKIGNFIIIEEPKIIKNNSNLIAHTSTITKEISDVLNEISKSLEDNQVTDIEKEKIIKEIDEAIEALLQCKESLK